MARTRRLHQSAVLGALLAVLGGFGVSEAQTVAPSLQLAVSEDPARIFCVWIFFVDKGYTAEAERRAVQNLEAVWCEESLERRAKVRTVALLDRRDLPVNKTYVERVESMGARVRTRSRWLNAVSVEIRGSEVGSAARLPEVRSIAPVGRYSGPRCEMTKGPSEASQDSQYGPSLEQVEQIQVSDLHNLRGLTGQGVRIGLLDTGFNREHESLQHVKVFAEWDFVNSDGHTANETGDPGDQQNHGTMTLSVIGGYKWGQLIGPAYGADYVLAKTEMRQEEIPVEEDYWVAGLEWAEALGVDIVSSSLGYSDWYSPDDLDGNTAVTTRAADFAAANGVLVVNSAGNEGPGDGIRNTLIAPADGDSVLAVGAVTRRGVRATFSSVGPTADGRTKPDVMARGDDAYAASPGGSQSYGWVDGTSFAAPLVAGLAALLLEAHPDWTPWDLISALRGTATRAGHPDTYYGYGICQGLQAVDWSVDPGMVASPCEIRLVSPNPFRPGDRIRFAGGAGESNLELKIYDGLGRLVFKGGPAAVRDGLRWDAADQMGHSVVPGVYFVHWTGMPRGRAHKLVLVR